MLKFAKHLLNKAPPLAETFQVTEEKAYEVAEPDFVLGQHTSFIGKIAFQKLAVIHGVFEGAFEGGEQLIVGPQGYVKGDIHLEEADISGKVEGNITVKTRLVLRSSAEVRGDITAPMISVEEGVSIMGQLHVTPLDTPDLHTPF